MGIALFILMVVSLSAATRLTAISLEGTKAFSPDELLRIADLKPGMEFTEERLNRGIDGILEHYDLRGYPFTSIVPERIGLEGDSVSVVLRVNEGAQARISRITVTGNKVTKSKVVLRELGFAEGDTYAGNLLEEGRQRLLATGFFKTVAPFGLQADPAGDDLFITVQVAEGPMNDIDGVIGYVPDETEGGYVTGCFNITVRNFFGSGRMVTARWEKRDRLSTDLAFTYEEPWLLGLPLAGGFSFAQLHKGTDDGLYNYSQTDLGLSLRLRMARYTEGSLELKSAAVFPDSATLAYMDRNRIWSVAVGARYDIRDYRLNPSAGHLYGAELTYGFREDGGDIRRISMDAEQYFRLIPRVTLALRTYGRLLMTDKADFSDLYPLGGSHSIRGYRDGQYYGSRVAWINTELKYFLEQRSAAYLFFDDGWYYRPELASSAGTAPDKQANRFGYGLGFSLYTRIGMLTLEYGLGQGDGIIDGKVHMGLAGRF